MHVIKYVLLAAMFSVNIYGEEPDYRTDRFREGGEFSVMVRCLYLGDKFSYATDSLELFERVSEKLNKTSVEKADLMFDAKTWWKYYPTQYELKEPELASIYWKENCEIPTSSMREYFSVENKI